MCLFYFHNDAITSRPTRPRRPPDRPTSSDLLVELRDHLVHGILHALRRRSFVRVPRRLLVVLEHVSPHQTPPGDAKVVLLLVRFVHGPGICSRFTQLRACAIISANRTGGEGGGGISCKYQVSALRGGGGSPRRHRPSTTTDPPRSCVGETSHHPSTREEGKRPT